MSDSNLKLLTKWLIQVYEQNQKSKQFTFQSQVYYFGRFDASLNPDLKPYNLPNFTFNLASKTGYDDNNDNMLLYAPMIADRIDDIKFLYQISLDNGIYYGFVNKLLVDNSKLNTNEPNEPLINPNANNGIVTGTNNYTKMFLYFLSLDDRFAGILFVGDYILDDNIVQDLFQL